ncbi:MAG: lysophospholipase [Lachnospiraceae bacterium]|nr:lysophospholipase [Lachnospiraceae bacterium]
MNIVLIVLAALLLGGVVVTMVLGCVLYTILMVRTSAKKWARECSMPSDPEQVAIYDRGWEWHLENEQYAKPVEITSFDKLKLVGEYYDFGFKRAAIIVVGRCETLLYSYYYAAPYKKLGFNVLVFDNRAHGLSEGKACYVGFREYRDVIGWAELLHKDFGMNEIHLHGLCIGSASALLAMTDEKCPDYVKTMIADGMFATFGDSYKQHIKEREHSLFPIYYESLFYMRLLLHINITSDGPLYRVHRMKKPIAFFHSRKDQYSEPALLEEIYEKCTAPKSLDWFEEGRHSRVRINNTEKYDLAIANFINRNYT